MGAVRATLWHYRGIHLLVILGVALASAVLAGSLLVSRSVSASLRETALERLGSTEIAVSTTTSFDARLAAAMQAASPDAIHDTTSLVIARGTATAPGTGRMAAGVHVYGVGDAFWSFHGVNRVVLDGMAAAISPGLADALDLTGAGELILRVSGPTDIPLGTLHGRRDEGLASMRVTVARTVEASRMGEFSLATHQGPVLAVFLPLATLQQHLNVTGRVNAILVRQAPRADTSIRQAVAAIERAWVAAASLSDYGVTLRRVPGDRVVAVDGRGGFIGPDIATRVRNTLDRLGRPGVPALAYVATSIRVGERVIPYSTVAAIDLDAYNRLSVPSGPPAPGTGPLGAGDQVVRGNLDVRVGTSGARVTRFSVRAPGARTEGGQPEEAPAEAPEPDGPSEPVPPPANGTIWLNEWAASDLGARMGDTVVLDYLTWTDAGGLETRTASFALQGIAPMMRIGGDRSLTPSYPGITNAARLSVWNPVFPVDASRVRSRDEAYWEQWRTAPKAIVPLETGQALWGTRFGHSSSIRFALQDADAVSAAIRSEMSAEVTVRTVRLEAMAAASETTNVGTYVLLASVLLAVPALVIAYLFFALGVEQRSRETGVLMSVGFTPADVRRGFLFEALVLTALGVLAGVAGALGYAALIMYGLRTWWVGAVGTTSLGLHVDPAALAVGVLGAGMAALIVLRLATRSLTRRSPRSLLSATAAAAPPLASRKPITAGLLLLAFAGGLIMAAVGGALDAAAGFFAAGVAVLVAGLLLAWAALARRRHEDAAPDRVLSSLWRLGVSHAAWRPARAVLALSLVASATFAMVSVAACRRDGPVALEKSGGTGGYLLMAEAASPLMYDPNTREGRTRIGLGESWFDNVTVTRARLRPGDDASRLNLYRPPNPRILGVNPASMVGRFSLAGGVDPAWTLLDTTFEDEAIPAMVDQSTLASVFRMQVGETFTFAPDGVTPVRFRIVAALADSVLHSGLIIGEEAFVRLFPRHEGYGIWLIEAPAPRAAELAAGLEERLAAYGVDVVDTRDRLIAYREVTNTYLSMLHAFGAVGLLLAVLCAAAVLARNVLERRREWGLLRALGYRSGHLARLVLAESAVLITGGVALGMLAGMLSVTPTLANGGHAAPFAGMPVVLGTAIVCGLAASLGALWTAARVPLVRAIGNE